MSAYNRMNGVYCGEHPILLTEILRDDWGFKGFVESDWILGTRSTAKAINAGMDIEMPAAYRFEREKIDAAMAGGELDEAVITRNARRSLYQKLAWDIGAMDRPDASVVECEAHLELAREVAEKSFVLLKNESLLPLRQDQRIAVVGELADTINLGDRGSSMVQSTSVVTPLQGLQTYSNQVSVSYLGAEATPANLSEFDVCIVVAGLTYREEGEFIPIEQQEAEGTSLARGGDRADLRLPPEQEAMISQAAAADVPVVVLVEAGSAIDMSAWVEKVTAVMMIWYPGCEGGHAVARVLFGDVNPSGRLPVSFPRALDQLMPWDINALDVEHDLYHGYRYLDYKGETPLFPFGFGLSYTSFALDGLQVERAEDRFFFNLSVTNTGDRAGAAVVQLYQSNSGSQVERVVKEMKGFGRVEIDVGETVDLEIEVEDENLCYYDPDSGWQLEACEYLFRVGLSSDALELESVWVFDGEDWEPR
jgi:beta-glucosidase